MANLRTQLEKNAKHHERDVKIHSPRNTEVLEIVLRTEHMAQVRSFTCPVLVSVTSGSSADTFLSCLVLFPSQAIGVLASKPPTESQPVSGLLISKDFTYTLLDPADLKDFTGLETSTITQRQKVVLDVGWELVKWHLEGMFGSVVEGEDKEGCPVLRVSLTDILLSESRKAGRTERMRADGFFR